MSKIIFGYNFVLKGNSLVKNIILIGFMGVGKGSVAREVIKHSEYVAIDTDDLIESMQNMTVKKIFAENGEEHFRALENKSFAVASK